VSVDGDSLTVTGGAGSLRAEWDDMQTLAAMLDASADELRSTGLRVAAVAVDGDVLASMVLAPSTGQQVVTSALAAAARLEVLALGMEADAVYLRAAVWAYQTADDTLVALQHELNELAGFAVGAGLTTVVAAAAVPLAATGAVAVGGMWLTAHALGDGAQLYSGLTGRPAMIPDGDALFDQWLGSTRDQLLGGLGDSVNGFLLDHPGVTDVLTDGSAGLMQGTAPLWTLGSLLSGGGLHAPPHDYDSAIALLIALGGGAGAFNDGRPGPTTATPRSFPTGDKRHPRSVSDLFAGLSSLYAQDTAPGTVRIVKKAGPDGGPVWTVQIVGTQEWSPTAGGNAADLTSNVRLMAGGQTTVGRDVDAAMRQAGIQPGDPVLLTGHSQGGITAASLASDPAFMSRYNVTDIVTGGSPIGRFDIPDKVNVLSIEHVQDPVPRLDGVPNPERHNWTTVHRHLTAAPDDGSPLTNVGQAHSGSGYTRTGKLVDDSTDPSLVRSRESLRRFLADQPDEITDYTMTRQP